VLPRTPRRDEERLDAHPREPVPDDLVRSAILTFRLANAYATNLAKCGLNNAPGDTFRSLSAFPERWIGSCYDQILTREIDILRPRVVFAFGTAVHDKLRFMITDQNVRIQQLPHPAGQQRGFRNEHYEVLYLWLKARALAAEGILSKDELSEYVSLFVANAPSSKKLEQKEPTEK
jgi:hypothetical protein